MSTDRPARDRAAAGPLRLLPHPALLLVALLGCLALGGYAGTTSAVSYNVPAAVGLDRAVVVRPQRIDVVSGGTLQRVIKWYPGPITLATVTQLVGDPTLLSSNSAGGYQLNGGLLETPGADLRVTAPEVSSLTLAPTAWLRGSHSALTIDGVNLTATPGSPASIRFSAASTVSVSNSRVSGLGRLGTPAIDLGAGTTADLQRDTFDQTGGVSVVGAQSGTLASLVLTGSTDAAVRLSRSSALTLNGLLIGGSAGEGLVISGPGPGPHVSGPLALVDNRLAGLRVNGLQGFRLDGATVRRSDARLAQETAAASGPRSSRQPAGVELAGCTGCTLAHLDVSGYHTGVVIAAGSTHTSVVGVHVGSGTVGVQLSSGTRNLLVAGLSTTVTGRGAALLGENATIRDSNISGGTAGVTIGAGGNGATVRDIRVTAAATGLVADGRSSGLRLDGLTVRGATAGAVRIAASDARLSHVDLAGGPTGLVVNGTANGVSVDGLAVRDATTSVLLTRQSSAVTLTRVQTQQLRGTSVRSSAVGLSLRDSRVNGGDVALDLHGTATIHNLSTTGGVEGVRVAPSSSLTMDGSSISASELGVRAGRDSLVTVTNGAITADVATRGAVVLRHVAVPRAQLRWLSVAAVAIIVVALLLEILRRRRDPSPRRGPGSAPQHVTNTA